VEQVIIFLKETDSPLAFVEAYQDETTYHGYRVIRLWEQTPETFLNEPALLPLASLARSKKPEELLIEVARKVREIPEPDAQRQISGCTEILAGLRFTEPVIRSLFREEVMKESVIYQSIHSQGLQQGLQQGLERGLQEEALRLVLRLLTLSLGEIPAYLKARIQTLSHEQLENLAESLLGFKQMGDVETWLQDI
jgi:predicted transposase YdaD